MNIDFSMGCCIFSPMKTVLAIFVAFIACAAFVRAEGDGIVLSLQDSRDTCRLIMYDSTPAGDVDSACASFAVFEGDPKRLIGSYATLGEALQNISNPEALKEIQLAWGRHFLEKFKTRAEAEAGIAVLEQSTGPRDLSLRLIREALPTMQWNTEP